MNPLQYRSIPGGGWAVRKGFHSAVSAVSPFQSVASRVPEGLTAATALRRAWASWFVMLAFPIVWIVLLIPAFPDPKGSPAAGLMIAIVAMVWLLSGTPVSSDRYPRLAIFQTVTGPRPWRSI